VSSTYNLLLDKQNIWDESIAHVRVFQAALSSCIKETISQASFNRTLNLMNHHNTSTDGFITQYIDILNCRFLDMNPQNISIMAKRLAERGDEYQQIKKEVIAAAKHYNCPVDNISPGVNYPEDVEW
jgi:hypothetical protein